jgi:hypothetical protein
MNKEDLLLEQWKMASELHRHEDNLTWQRFSYMVTINGVLASAVGIIWSTSTKLFNQRDAFILISLFGIITSLVFTFILRRAFMYQKYRITQAKQTEKKLLINDKQILNLYEFGLEEQKLIRVSHLAKFSTNNLISFLSLLFVLFWIFLLFISFFYLKN